MNTLVIGDVLPYAIGIAISPIPIIAAILMLLSPRAAGTGVGFMLGWLSGITVTVTVFTMLASILPDDEDDGSHPIRGTLRILLGALLLLLAAKQWRGRPAPGEEAKPPKWMAAIDQMTAARGYGLGFLLSAVNPKNLVMSASAGLVIGTAASVSAAAWSILLFVVLAGSTVLLPVVSYLLAADRMRAPLESLRVWLLQHNGAVMATLFLIIGSLSIGKGIGNL